MNDAERFLANMEYQPADRVPNHELGAWGQTRELWIEAGAPVDQFKWDWFCGEDALGLDKRGFIPVNYGMIPAFEPKVLEKHERWEIIQSPKGIISKALTEGCVGGTRMSMDQYLEWPVKSLDDFRELQKRYDPRDPARLPQGWLEQAQQWREEGRPIVCGRNCGPCGFYWKAREWMGTEHLSFAWYDQPELCHEMMEFFADFTIEVSRPVVEQIQIDYFNLNEDCAMKGGPLLGPDTFRKFIEKPMRRLVEFLKSNGVRYVCLDSDGDPRKLIPLWMDCGIDCIWPLERASDMDPAALRKEFGKSLRLWGGVDKRELAKGRDAITAHLQSLAPLVEEGGFIPTVDHTVPPDVSWDNFRYYMDEKQKLLEGRL